MRAALYKDKLVAEIVKLDTPRVGLEDVLVKTVRSSICGSDVNGVGVLVDGQFGHETAGYIVDMGKNVTGFAEGDRVWINPMNAMQSALESCMLGGFSDYILVPHAKLDYNLYLLPETISWDEASLIEPFGVGTRGKNRPGVKTGDNVVVYGAGSIGLFCISALVAQGIIPVVVDIALSDYKRTLLEKIGAVIAPLDGDKFTFFKEHFGMTIGALGEVLNIDVVVDCAGAPTIIQDFFRILKENSRLSIVGVNNVPQEMSLRLLMAAESTVMGSKGYRHEDVKEVIDNLSHQRTLVKEIITHHFPLEEINEALRVATSTPLPFPFVSS